MSADNLPRPLTAAWPDTQSWWDVLRAALATDLDDVHFHRRMLRQEGVALAYGDAEAVAALRDVWADRDALQRRMDAVRAWAESVLLASTDEDGPDIDVLRNAARHVLDLLDDRPTDGQKETHATT